ncbi:MAG TPA: hypothetical protein VFE61_29115 [Candidatus Sulfotelmatobacter sp.]|jgi:hypothetical protein|nr:hypothetical protein [Candidatus Sulfotelmatobacter sp.]
MLSVVANDHKFGHDRKTRGDDKSNNHITGAEQSDEDFTLTILALTLETGCLAEEAW